MGHIEPNFHYVWIFPDPFWFQLGNEFWPVYLLREPMYILRGNTFFEMVGSVFNINNLCVKATIDFFGVDKGFVDGIDEDVQWIREIIV